MKYVKTGYLDGTCKLILGADKNIRGGKWYVTSSYNLWFCHVKQHLPHWYHKALQATLRLAPVV